MSSLQGKIAIVTGASRGLGRSVAEAMADAGSRLVLAARTSEQLFDLATRLERRGTRVVPVLTDVANEEQVEHLVSYALEQFGRIDILINNAGFNCAKPFEQLTSGDFDSVMNVNLRGPFLCTRAVYPRMIAQGGGTIVNVGSVLSMKAYGENTVYCASKYALLGFSRSLMIEAKNYNIRVMAFLPGGMQTSWYDSRPGIDTSRMMQPDSVAQLLIHALEARPDLVPFEIIVAPSAGTSWP